MPKNKIIPYELHLVNRARELRKNMTPGEVLLWQRIRKRQLGVQFHRQVPINKYIVDFYCHEIQLAIEIDGSSHDHPDQSGKDLERQTVLENLGVRVIRFSEAEVLEKPVEVLQTIKHVADTSPLQGR